MKKVFTAFLLLACLFCCGKKTATTVDPEFVYPDDTLALSVSEASSRMAEIAAKWKDTLSLTLENGYIKRGENTMKIWYKVYGEKPADGRSMYISMHGGGNAPASVNDQQWENQKVLYAPAEGVYVAPRSPWNDWDLWFKNPLDDLFADLIQAAVKEQDVNPNKVYLMGYSAGGDGVWRMGPRMADTWAAASMMAGHPGDVSLLSLRNTPFMIWCGALDSAYNRNEECAARGLQMDTLQMNDPAGYIHETHIVEGKEHWMDRVDTAAVAWMASHVRTPYPDKVVWCQGDRIHQYFYWIGLPDSEFANAKKFDTIVASIKDNTIALEQYPESLGSIDFYLNDTLVNLDKPITVTANGKVLFTGKVNRTSKMMKECLRTRGDLAYIFPSKLTVTL